MRLWALQRYYEDKHESRFLEAIWPKVFLIQDLDDPDSGKAYGSFYDRTKEMPDLEKIKKTMDIGFSGQRPETHGMKPNFVHR